MRLLLSVRFDLAKLIRLPEKRALGVLRYSVVKVGLILNLVWECRGLKYLSLFLLLSS